MSITLEIFFNKSSKLSFGDIFHVVNPNQRII